MNLLLLFSVEAFDSAREWTYRLTSAVRSPALCLAHVRHLNEIADAYVFLSAKRHTRLVIVQFESDENLCLRGVRFEPAAAIKLARWLGVIGGYLKYKQLLPSGS